MKIIDPFSHEVLFESDDIHAIFAYVNANPEQFRTHRDMTLFRVTDSADRQSFIRGTSSQHVEMFYQAHAVTMRPAPAFPLVVSPVIGDELACVMNAMEPSWRYSWCDGGMCGCMGCSNRSGSLMSLGFEREEWEAWVAINPNPRKDQASPIIRFDLF